MSIKHLLIIVAASVSIQVDGLTEPALSVENGLDSTSICSTGIAYAAYSIPVSNKLFADEMEYNVTMFDAYQVTFLPIKTMNTGDYCQHNTPDTNSLSNINTVSYTHLTLPTKA